MLSGSKGVVGESQKVKPTSLNAADNCPTKAPLLPEDSTPGACIQRGAVKLEVSIRRGRKGEHSPGSLMETGAGEAK